MESASDPFSFPGDDSIQGGAGSDDLRGDAGDDTFTFCADRTRDTIDGGAGTGDTCALAEHDVDLDSLVSIESKP
jgi:hypothetical protein